MVSTGQELVDIIIKLVTISFELANVIGELITFVINIGAQSFGFRLPAVVGNIILEGVGIILIVWSIQKNMKWFVFVAIILVMIMMSGGIISFFFPGLIPT